MSQGPPGQRCDVVAPPRSSALGGGFCHPGRGLGRAGGIVGRQGGRTLIYKHFGQDPTMAADMQQEGLELLIKLWTEQDITWQGKFRGTLEGVTLQPRPVQTPHPPIYVACGSLGSVEVPAVLASTSCSRDCQSLSMICRRWWIDTIRSGPNAVMPTTPT